MGKTENTPLYLPSGDTGLTVRLGDVIDRQTSERVAALGDAIAAAGLPGVIETVPSYLSLLVHYDPLKTSQAEVISAIEALRDVSAGKRPQPRSWSLPVCFDDPEFAPDLGHVATWADETPEQVVEDIVSTELFVYMIGFAPGQPYLGDLPDRLDIPRREVPVQAVPTGSVLVAVGKVVIYPNENPTGWHIVGRTPVPLFDLSSDPPALLRAGDHVRLAPVSRAVFDRIVQEVSDGSFVLRPETGA